MRSFKTRTVESHELANYIVRAHHCHLAARFSLERSWWYASCILSIHSAISWADSITIVLKKQRFVGTEHDDAVAFFSTLQLRDSSFRENVNRLGSIIAAKTQAEYTGELLNENDARRMLKQLDRFRSFVVKHIPKSLLPEEE